MRAFELYKEKISELVLEVCRENRFNNTEEKLSFIENVLAFNWPECNIDEAFVDKRLQDYVSNVLLPNTVLNGNFSLTIAEAPHLKSPKIILDIGTRDKNVKKYANKISDKIGLIYLIYDTKEKAMNDASLIRAAFADDYDFEIHNKFKKLGENQQKQLSDPITQQELNALEAKLDQMYAALGMDVEFTRHFLDRVNDPRNIHQITIEELFKLFQEELKVYGKKIAQAGPDFEAVMNDISTMLNVPFVLNWNRQKGELEVVAKTVMRKDNFRTPGEKFIVGRTSKKRY